jgi:phosphoglycerate dehydrogenase-like enzyme
MTRRALHVTVPDAGWIDSLSDVDGIDLSVWDLDVPQPVDHVDLAVQPYMAAPQRLASLDAGRIGVIQSQSLGYDGVAESLPAGITFCNAVGVHEESTAELAVALLLASQREIDRYARERGDWNPHFTGSLIDRRLLVLGTGGIGQQIVRRLDGFGAELVRVATARRDDERGTIHGQDELPALLPTVDAVVLAVPLSDATTHLVDDAFLSALPDGAVVVNVSRGKVVDTDAVVRQGGRVRLAADVTDPEPLPSEHPLWTTPGVLVSPHIGGMSSAMRPRVEAVVRRQIELLKSGLPPHSVVLS